MAIGQLECFRQTMAHCPHEAVLTTMSFTPDLHSRLRAHLGLPADGNVIAHYGLFQPHGVAPRCTDPIPASEFMGYYTDIDVPEGLQPDGWGVLRKPGDYYHFTKIISPLRNATSLSDIEAFPFLDYSRFDDGGLAERVDQIHAAGRVAAGSIGHIFETAWQIRGLEPFLMDMIVAPENCDFIFDRIYELQKARACALARAGVDYLHTGDDVATQNAMMFGADKWRQFLKPRWGDIYASVRRIKPDIHIWYHSDGNIRDIVPELIEIGVDILNPVQPECLDPFEIKREFGDQIVLWGCVGTQSTMPFGTPGDVRDTVRRYIDVLGADGALVLAPTHVLEPEVPIANIEALVETVKEYGELA